MAEPVRISAYGGGGLTLAHVNAEESEVLQGAFRAGSKWVRLGEDGRIEHHDAFDPLPAPSVDVVMHPFWNPALPGETSVQYEMFSHLQDADRNKHTSASITIQHLCGYGYTPENYADMAELLGGYGFECLRSRRGESGQFWEIWFLPGAWAAKGRLKEAIFDSGHSEEKLKTDAAVEFIRRTASFGTLDVSVQRLAQVIE